MQMSSQQSRGPAFSSSPHHAYDEDQQSEQNTPIVSQPIRTGAMNTHSSLSSKPVTIQSQGIRPEGSFAMRMLQAKQAKQREE